jgi:hypothetical protein
VLAPGAFVFWRAVAEWPGSEKLLHGQGHRANRSVSAPSVGDTVVRFPTAIVGIVLKEFSAYVWSDEPGVRHYGRQG